ncbi:HNH endonuclease family protein [Amycolatopsis sp. ATCC 39116]|uniref:HNH endonuclease family protein n=1 Tax=Amycolatopsis sp. (strain ATCC 39116 / 75iv2) TaxID=385957 RepID=UPI0002625CF2|nr:HNH endonuclease family protein [Amycolatopsis sp. ATCC 39116]
MNRAIIAALLAAGTLATACQLPPTGATSGATPAPDAAAALRTLDTLPVAPADTGYHYRREDWPHWDNAPQAGRGCDVRDAVLIAQGRNVHVSNDGKCKLTGEWTSPYDGVTVTDPGKFDVDHIVPLAEVARSGAIENGRRVGPRLWSRADRERYANDPSVLVAASASSNRAKGDQDPAKWIPAQGQCDYAARWVEVKSRYALSVDTAERQALAGVLRRC